MSTGILDIRSPPPPDNPVLSYVSASRLNLWLKCPLAFRIKYVDGVRTPTSPALYLGKRVHDGLEHYYRHRQLGVTLSSEEVSQRVLDTWDSGIDEEELGVTFKDERESQDLRDQGVRLVQAYLAQVGEEPPPQAVETSLEAPLVDPTTGENLGIPLLGTVDLVLPSLDGPVICDFKTSSKSGPPFEVAHEIQLSCYAYLFRCLAGQREANLQIRSLIKTKTPKIDRHTYPSRSETHFRRLFAVIRAYLDDVHSDRYVYRPGFGCTLCDYRDQECQSWPG